MSSPPVPVQSQTNPVPITPPRPTEIHANIIQPQKLNKNNSPLLTGSKCEVTLRLTVSQSICLVIEHPLGLATRYYFLSECCCLKLAVLFLWDALSDGRTGLQFAVQSLNEPSRAEPVTRLYCLI
jgi:hypothetical protein